MSGHFTKLGDPVTIVVISFADARHLDRYRRVNDLTVPVLLDPDRQVYRRYGLDRGSIRQVYGWRTMRRYAQIIRRRGFRDLRRATEDTRQLGGDFVVDAQGILAFGHWSTGPYDRPSIDDLAAAVT